MFDGELPVCVLNEARPRLGPGLVVFAPLAVAAKHTQLHLADIQLGSYAALKTKREQKLCARGESVRARVCVLNPSPLKALLYRLLACVALVIVCLHPQASLYCLFSLFLMALWYSNTLQTSVCVCVCVYVCVCVDGK